MISNDLSIFKYDWKMKDEDAEEIINSLTKEDHARFIGTNGIGKVRSGCGKNKGYHVGEGVCLLYKFIERRIIRCIKCKGKTPIEQLNWLFRNHSDVKFDGLVAEWNFVKKKQRKERKGIVETPYFSGKLCQVIEEVETQND